MWTELRVLHLEMEYSISPCRGCLHRVRTPRKCMISRGGEMDGERFAEISRDTLYPPFSLSSL